MKRLDARHLSPQAQETLRLRVSRAVQGGMSQTEAARVFGVSRQSVNGWSQRRRQQGGVGALRARPTAGALVAAVSGSHDRAPDYRPVSRSTQDALCALDPGGRARSDRPAVRDATVRLDRGPLPPAVGLHPAKTLAPRLRTGPRGGGSRTSIRPSGPGPPAKARRSSGATRPACARTIKRAAPGGAGAGRRSSLGPGSGSGAT